MSIGSWRKAAHRRGRAIAGGAAAVAAYAGGLFGALREKWRRDAVLAQLKGLDDRTLQDIGLTRGGLHAAAYAHRAVNANVRGGGRDAA